MAIEPKLDEAMRSQPLLPHLLSFPVVLNAVGIGAITAFVLDVAVSPFFAGLGLLGAFFASWLHGATRRYEGRQETRDARSRPVGDGE